MGDRIQLIRYRLYNKIDIKLDVYDRITTIYGDSGDGKTYLFSVFRTIFEDDSKYIFIDYRNKEKIRSLRGISNSIIWIDNADIVLSESDKIYISSDINNYYIINGRNTTGLCVNAYRLAKLVRNENEISLDFPYLN